MLNYPNLVALLKIHEGVKNFPYTDTVGKVTIGVGHNLTDNGLTDAQIANILNDDIDDTLLFLTTHCSWFADMDDVRQLAIADLTFDIRAKLLDFHQMIANIIKQDWDAAADDLLNSKFAQQAPNRAKDLAHILRTGLGDK